MKMLLLVDAIVKDIVLIYSNLFNVLLKKVRFRILLFSEINCFEIHMPFHDLN